MNDQPKLAVIGQGYVGLPLALRAADVGFDVVGYDVDKSKISSLTAAKSYVDDVTDADLRRALAGDCFHATDASIDLAGFDVAVIAVPTPLREGIPDVSYIEDAARVVGRHLEPGALVVLESTTFPGTTEEVVGPILEDESGLTAGGDFLLGYSPERIDPGNQVWDFQRTPKVVSGVDDRSLEAVRAFYDRLVAATVPVSGTAEAELTKLLENTFRHVNIALGNELAVHARSLDIDIWEVIDAAGTKPFGFMPFYPGPGVGGHCLPIDPTFLSWRFERQLGTVSRFVKIANEINESMPDYVVRRVQAGLNERLRPVKQSRILVLGVAYKKNSNDARETPATEVIRGLLDLGADVAVHDRHVADYELDESIDRIADLTVDEIEAADVVILLTDHDDVDYELALDHADYIFDARRRLPAGPTVELL
ncbi:MAG: nucleotide sugar dehydrogenase [Acidimicrobiales bacterium]